MPDTDPDRPDPAADEPPVEHDDQAAAIEEPDPLADERDQLEHTPDDE